MGISQEENKKGEGRKRNNGGKLMLYIAAVISISFIEKGRRGGLLAIYSFS